MKRVRFSANQRVTAPDAMRLQKLWQMALLDVLAANVLRRADTGAKLANKEAGYLGDSGVVVYLSGAREAGMTFAVGYGLGIKNDSTDITDEDEPQHQPIYQLSGTNTVALSASDPTYDRIDQIYAKPRNLDTDNESRDFINPSSGAYAGASTDTTQEWLRDVAVAEGTPAASPSAPSAPAGYDDEDLIAEVIVRAGSGSFNSADLTDKRIHLVPVLKGAQADRIDPVLSGTDLADDITTVWTSVTSLGSVVTSNLSKITALEGEEVRFRIEGAHNGRLVYVDDDSVSLNPKHDSRLVAYVNGTTLQKTTASGVLTFDLTTHLIGSRTASTWYSLYINKSGSNGMAAIISATGPDAAGKLATYDDSLWVGDILLDGSANIRAFDQTGANEYHFRRPVNVSLPTTHPVTPYASASVAAAVPATATHILGDVNAAGQDMRLLYGHRDIIGLTPDLDSMVYLALLQMRTEGGNPAGANYTERKSRHVSIPLQRGFREIAYGVIDRDTGDDNPDLTTHVLAVSGWRSSL